MHRLQAKAPTRTGKLVTILTFVLLGWMASTSCFAYELYVNWTANPIGADGSIANPYVCIQHAIDHALDNTLPENNTQPYPAININVYNGDYLENVALNYIGSCVSDITIRNFQGEENCAVIGTDSQQPVIFANGNSTSKLLLSGIKISSVNSNISSRGVKIGADSPSQYYFGTFEMINCVNDFFGVAIEADLHALASIKVTESTFIHRFGDSCGVKSALSDLGEAQAIINSNTFTYMVSTNWIVTSIRLAGRSYKSVYICNNDMEESQTSLYRVGNLTNTDISVYIENNHLTNSQLNVQESSCYVLNNTFSGCSNFFGSSSSVLYLCNSTSTEVIAIVNDNIFINCLTAILLKVDNNVSNIWKVAAFVEGNSFINCSQIVKLQRATGYFTSNTVKQFRNNLSTSSSQSVFDICDLYGNPITLPEAEKIPISYSHFANQLNPCNSLIIGTNVSFGDPGIVIDDVNQPYTLRWDENMRSPLILSGFVEGQSIGNFDDRPDIGAVQYDAHPHEHSTYIFPAGNDRNGIKWMSFPSLDRLYDDEDMALTFFEPLRSPFVLDNMQWKILNGSPDFLRLNGDEWDGSNHIIQPQVGYKFQMNPGLPEPVYISTPAIKPDQDLPITLKARTNAKSTIPDNENWLGYFGESTVHPYDAFAGVLDNLWYIQSQNWTLARLSVTHGSPWIGVAYPGSKPPTLKYGDMVIVKCFNDAVFTWNSEAPEQDEFIRNKPSCFTFPEKMDYIPVYVEFCGSEIPTEAAVFLEGECKGAAVVGGNCVEIPAYILDDIAYGAELELRVSYNNKASYNPIPRYQTWNQDTGEYEHTALSLSERKPYYMLKMDTGSINDTPAPKLYMGNYPNPFNPDTTLRFSLPENADMHLEIYNVKGQKVRSLINGSYNAGSHTCLWDAKDNTGTRVSSGIYFAVLSYKGNQLSRKLLLMK